VALNGLKGISVSPAFCQPNVYLRFEATNWRL
jgi:hypothetical protein